MHFAQPNQDEYNGAALWIFWCACPDPLKLYHPL